MKIKKLEIEILVTERLILKPLTSQVCRNLLNNDFSDLEIWNFKKGKS